jgi:hypothetical protein
MTMFFLFVLIFLSLRPAANLLSAGQMMNTSYNQWHLMNSYGAFGSIGKKRYEIVLKGTADGEINAETEWQEYEFVCKPGDVRRRPCLITPYHLRLDWQIWFSAMRPQLSEEWLFRLVVRLLEGDPQILRLLAKNPFAESPPTFIKMDLYHYEFAELEMWPEFWWQRRFVKSYMPPVSLNHQAVAPYRESD